MLDFPCDADLLQRQRLQKLLLHEFATFNQVHARQHRLQLNAVPARVVLISQNCPIVSLRQNRDREEQRADFRHKRIRPQLRSKTAVHQGGRGSRR